VDLNHRPRPYQASLVRFYNNLKDRGDCQTTRKSYKTYVLWVELWVGKLYELRSSPPNSFLRITFLVDLWQVAHLCLAWLRNTSTTPHTRERQTANSERPQPSSCPSFVCRFDPHRPTIHLAYGWKRAGAKRGRLG